MIFVQQSLSFMWSKLWEIFGQICFQLKKSTNFASFCKKKNSKIFISQNWRRNPGLDSIWPKKIFYTLRYCGERIHPKKHGAVNKLLQGCHVWVPLGFLSLVNFHWISIRQKWFQIVQRIFHEKTDPKLPDFEGKKFPNFLIFMISSSRESRT